MENLKTLRELRAQKTNLRAQISTASTSEMLATLREQMESTEIEIRRFAPGLRASDISAYIETSTAKRSELWAQQKRFSAELEEAIEAESVARDKVRLGLGDVAEISAPRDKAQSLRALLAEIETDLEALTPELEFAQTELSLAEAREGLIQHANDANRHAVAFFNLRNQLTHDLVEGLEKLQELKEAWHNDGSKFTSGVTRYERAFGAVAPSADNNVPYREKRESIARELVSDLNAISVDLTNVIELLPGFDKAFQPMILPRPTSETPEAPKRAALINLALKEMFSAPGTPIS